MLRGLVLGLLAGAATSVLPLEIFLLGPVGLGVLFVMRVQRARRESNRALLGQSIAMLVTAVLVAMTSVLLPFKYFDREGVALGASCVTVAQLAASLRVHAPAVSASALAQSVCFDSVHPALREVASALETQAHLVLKAGYCGSGATILFGAHPIRFWFAAAP